MRPGRRDPARKDYPSKPACLACHDDEDTYAHAYINTYTDEDGNETESCDVCHGVDADFSVEEVHNIADPYVYPYVR